LADYVQQLMPSLPAQRLRTLSVGHVVPGHTTHAYIYIYAYTNARYY